MSSGHLTYLGENGRGSVSSRRVHDERGPGGRSTLSSRSLCGLGKKGIRDEERTLDRRLYTIDFYRK